MRECNRAVIKVPDVLENKVIRTRLLAECSFCCDIAEKTLWHLEQAVNKL